MPRVKKPISIGTVLGLDPGRINFAFSIYGKEGILDHGDVEGAESFFFVPFFRIRMLRKLYRYRPQAVFIERYHSRPGAGAVLNMELANVMIGIVYEQCSRLKIPCYTITASAHKGWAYRNMDVPTKIVTRKGVTKEIHDLESYPEYQHLPTEHEIDATNLAKYGYEKLKKEMENDAQ